MTLVLKTKKLETFFDVKSPIAAPIPKIAIATIDGFTFVEVKDIIRCEADGKHTVWHLNNKTKLRSSQILKIVEQKLHDHNFHRIHHGHLINILHLDQYTKIKGGGGIVSLSNGENLSISHRKKTSFLKQLDKLH